MFYTSKRYKIKRLTLAMQSVRVGGGSLGFDLPKILFIFGLTMSKNSTCKQYNTLSFDVDCYFTRMKINLRHVRYFVVSRRPLFVTKSWAIVDDCTAIANPNRLGPIVELLLLASLLLKIIGDYANSVFCSCPVF